MRIAPAIGVLCIAANPINGGAQSAGNVDALFGVGGNLVIDAGYLDQCADIVTANNDQIYVVGAVADYSGVFDVDYLIARADSAGNPDMAFGTNGVLRADFPGFDCSQITDAHFAGGWLYVTGSGYNQATPDTQRVFIAKLDAAGVPDPAFGNGGIVTRTFLGYHDNAGELCTDDAGRILVTMVTLDSSLAHMEVSVFMRLLPDGTPDSSFAGTGVISWSPQTGLVNQLVAGQGTADRHADGAVWKDILVLDDGYLLSGYYFLGEGHVCFSVKVNDTGQLDAGFGQGGILIFDPNPGFSQISLVRDAVFTSGGVVLLVDLYNGDDSEFLLQPVSAIGALLPRLTYDFSGFEDHGRHAVSDMYGNIIVAGYSRNPANQSPGYSSDHFAVLRCDGSGAADASFGALGQVSLAMQPGDESGAEALCVTESNNYLVAGYRNTGDPLDLQDIVVTRVIGGAPVNGVAPIVENQLRAWPNPASNQLYFSQSGIQVQVLTISGECVLRGEITNGMLDISPLPNGFYVVKSGSMCMPMVVSR
jgi:uncharacterized delta-60 repeat protein